VGGWLDEGREAAAGKNIEKIPLMKFTLLR